MKYFYREAIGNIISVIAVIVLFTYLYVNTPYEILRGIQMAIIIGASIQLVIACSILLYFANRKTKHTRITIHHESATKYNVIIGKPYDIVRLHVNKNNERLYGIYNENDEYVIIHKSVTKKSTVYMKKYNLNHKQFTY